MDNMCQGTLLGIGGGGTDRETSGTLMPRSRTARQGRDHKVT